MQRCFAFGLLHVDFSDLGVRGAGRTNAVSVSLVGSIVGRTIGHDFGCHPLGRVFPFAKAIHHVDRLNRTRG